MTTPYLQHSLASLAHELLSPGAGFALRKRLVKQLLPYAAVEIKADDDEIRTYVLLNREHKPLGWPLNLKAYLNYASADFKAASIRLHFHAVEDAALYPITTAHGTFWYLYGHDVPAPWESADAAALYVEKLCALLDISGICEDGAVLFQASEAAP